MNTRVKRRKNQLEKQTRTPCTGIIKIGKKSKTSRGVEYPDQLNGFVIYHQRVDANNKSIIDYDAMEMLGSPKSAVDKAIVDGKKGTGLPTELHFFIQRNANSTDGGWEYPDTFREEYICYDANGKFCEGDGNRAKQRQPDRTEKEIICNPVGCGDLDPNQVYCPHSINSQEKDKKQKTCNYKYYLFISLFVPDKETGEPRPLNMARDFGARYGISSGSETCGMEIGEALDAAADYLGGNIHEISGILHFGKKGKHYFEKNTKRTSYVPQIYMVLSPVDIGRRKHENRAMLLEDRSFQAALPAPSIVEEPEIVDAEHKSISPADATSEITETAPDTEPTLDEEPLEEIQIDDAQDHELIQALEALSLNLSCEFGQVARFQHEASEGGIYSVPEPAWFDEDDEEFSNEWRQSVLRRICVFLKKHHPAFIVFRIPVDADVVGEEEAPK